MKKALVMILGAFLLVNATYASLSNKKGATKHTVIKKNVKKKGNNKSFARQCCTQTHVIDASSGASISITACAGWFLSDNDRAMSRACEKANTAWESYMGRTLHLDL